MSGSDGSSESGGQGALHRVAVIPEGFRAPKIFSECARLVLAPIVQDLPELVEAKKISIRLGCRPRTLADTEGRKTMDTENQADEMRCFWCTGFWDKYEQPVIIARQVCDTDGSHEELTFLHHDCALAAVRELFSVRLFESVNDLRTIAPIAGRRARCSAPIQAVDVIFSGKDCDIRDEHEPERDGQEEPGELGGENASEHKE